MFKEILRIIPTLDEAALRKMDRNLSQRFKKVAKGFGKGLVGALTGGGVVGLAVGLIDKLLNPIKEANDAIDRTLTSADDLSAYAKQFGTTAGKLEKLVTAGKATGLGPENLFMLIEKFQSAVAEASADPTKQTSVRQYANENDSAAAFFNFIQNLQGLDKNKQIQVQQEVFGEKQILKMADFLGTNFAVLLKQINKSGPTAAQMDSRLNTLGDIKDREDLQRAILQRNDLYRKGGIINNSMSDSRIAAEARALDKENKVIKSYNDLAQISMASDEILSLLKDVLLGLTGLLVKFTDLGNNVKKLTDGAGMKNILKWMGSSK